MASTEPAGDPPPAWSSACATHRGPTSGPVSGRCLLRPDSALNARGRRWSCGPRAYAGCASECVDGPGRARPWQRPLGTTLAAALAVAVALAAGPRALAQPTVPGPATTAASPGASEAPSPIWPTRPPDATAGLTVFAEHCAACHGPVGRGDGDLVGQLPAPPPDLAAPARRMVSSPADDFRTVTDGRMDRMMPPFGPSLSDTERWDVVVALRSFAETPHARVRGRATWAARCATCHEGDGADGAMTDGPDRPTTNGAAPLAGRLADLAVLGGIPDGVLETWLLEPEGRSTDALPAPPPAVRAEHARAVGDLTPAARRDLMALVRAMSYAALDVGGLVAGIGLQGRVVNATPGGVPAADDVVTLVADGGTVPEPPMTASVAADGTFAFDDVVGGAVDAADVAYTSFVAHAGGRFASARPITVTATGAGTTREPPADGGAGRSAPLDVGTLMVWDTDATLVLPARMLHTVVAPDPSRGVLEIVERWVLSNATDRAAVGVRIALPTGARDVRFADPLLADARFENERFVHPLALPPGEHEVVVVYDVPYAARQAEFGRDVLQPVADASLTIADLAVRVGSDALVASEAVTIGRTAALRYRFAPLATGSRLVVRLDDLPPSGAGAQDVVGARPPSPVAPEVLTWVALAVSALGLAVAGASARRSPAYRAASRSRSLATLRVEAAALERARAAGDVAPNAYALRRARLVERAARLLSEGDRAVRDKALDHPTGDAP